MLKDILLRPCTFCGGTGSKDLRPDHALLGQEVACPVCVGTGEVLNIAPLERILEPGEDRRYSLHRTAPEYYR